MLLLIYWVAAALAARRWKALRWFAIAAGLVGVALMSHLSWTLRVHQNVTFVVIGIQLLAAWACAVDDARSPWIWAYLALSQIVLVQSEGSAVAPQLAGLAMVAAAAVARPSATPTAVAAACVVEAAWSSLRPPAALYIADLMGRWMDVVEIHAPTLSLLAVAIAAVVALLAMRLAKPSRPAAALFVVLAFAVQWTLPTSLRLQPGTVLTVGDVARLLPANARGGVVYAPSIPTMSATVASDGAPAWLYFSNNPEVVTAQRTQVLARSTVPAGRGRLLISHYVPGMASLVVEYLNPGPSPCRVVVHRFEHQRQQVGPMLECGVALWQRFATAAARGEVHELAPKGVWRETMEASGSVMAMGEVECSAPLVVTTGLTWDGQLDTAATVEPLSGAQTRGLFEAPDQTVTARFNPDEGRPRRITLGQDPLKGTDLSDGTPRAATLQGRYGGISHVKLQVTSPGARRVLLLLVPGGGWCGALYGQDARGVNAHQGLVLLNRVVQADTFFEYDFTLPANSWGPVHLVAVPM